MNGGAMTAMVIAASNIRIFCLDGDCPLSLPPRAIGTILWPGRSPCQAPELDVSSPNLFKFFHVSSIEPRLTTNL
jgi:hypothetical protein